MPKVRMPDGVVVAFPDDMPPEQIKSLIASKFPEVETGMGGDIARSAATGVREGLEGLAGQFGDAANLQGDIAGWVANKFGASPETAETVRKWGSRLHPAGMMASTEDIRRLTNPAVEAAGAQGVLAHTPATTAGEYARTGGQFLPAAASPGGFMKKTASVVVPAALSETAGQMTEGTAWEPYARFLGALTGGVATAGKSASTAGPRTTVADLKAAGSQAYNAADAAGIVINKAGMRTLARNIVDDLTDHGFDPANEPGAVAALKRITQHSNGNVTLKGLDTIRKVASNGYIPGNQSNNKVVSQIVERIDELIASADPSLMAGANTPAGVAALKEARAHWHRARKLETVEGFVDKGQVIGNSQINQDVEGATRRQVRQLLTNKAKARGFTKAELDAAKTAASMSKGMRALRATSGLLPQGKLGGMMQAVAAAGHGFNPIGFGLQGLGMGVGYAAKKGEEALSRRAMEDFVDIIANGAPRAKGSRIKQLTKAEEIRRLLLLSQLSSTPVRSPVEQLNR